MRLVKEYITIILKSLSVGILGTIVVVFVVGLLESTVKNMFPFEVYCKAGDLEGMWITYNCPFWYPGSWLIYIILFAMLALPSLLNKLYRVLFKKPIFKNKKELIVCLVIMVLIWIVYQYLQFRALENFRNSVLI